MVVRRIFQILQKNVTLEHFGFYGIGKLSSFFLCFSFFQFLFLSFSFFFFLFLSIIIILLNHFYLCSNLNYLVNSVVIDECFSENTTIMHGTGTQEYNRYTHINTLCKNLSASTNIWFDNIVLILFFPYSCCRKTEHPKKS